MDKVHVADGGLHKHFIRRHSECSKDPASEEATVVVGNRTLELLSLCYSACVEQTLTQIDTINRMVLAKM